MNIKIPKTFKRYAPSVMNKLTDLGYFDDVDEIKNKSHLIGLDVLEELEVKETKIIGLWMSGGADSSLLAWMLCKKIRDEHLDIDFQPLSVRRGRPNNPIYAGNVVDFIEDDLGIKMKEHVVYYPDKEDEYQIEIKEFRDRDMENFNNCFIDIMYSGITSNPPEDDDSIPLNKERTRDESADKPIESWGGFAYYINPFFQINKKGVAKLYDQFGLTRRLFPLTYSCEGPADRTNTHTQHCGKCWWCLERVWAFGFLTCEIETSLPQFIYD